MGWSELRQLRRAVAHPMLPLAGLQTAPVRLQAIEDLGHAARTAKVGSETSQAVVDDVSMRIVEARQHAGAFEIDHTRPRALERHQPGAAGGNHRPAGNREVAVDPKTRGSKRADATAGEDPIGFHARLE